MLSGKVIVITGGSGLLGREFSAVVAKNNGIAIIADIDESRGAAVLKDLKSSYPKASLDYYPLDITNQSSIASLVDTLHKKYGRIDALVNNAYPRNKNYGRSFFEVNYDDFCDNVSMHLGGYFLISQIVAKYFFDQGYGNILNISSIYGLIPPRFEVYDGTDMTMPVEYAVIKSGVLHLTKYMAKAFKGKNIRVNAICPGGIKAGQPEKFLAAYKNLSLNKGMLDKADIVGTLLYLLSDLSACVNGQVLVVDDGFSL